MTRGHADAAFAQMLRTVAVDEPGIGAGHRAAAPLRDATRGGGGLNDLLLLEGEAGKSKSEDGNFERAQRICVNYFTPSLRTSLHSRQVTARKQRAAVAARASFQQRVR